LSSNFVCRTAVAALVVLLASPAFAWTVRSRELVDVEMLANGALSILLSAPGTESPGLYHWAAGVAAPKKLCAINAASFISFNRRVVIERIRGEQDSLRLYDVSSCAVLGQVDTRGRVIDADARGALVAAAVEYSDGERALELYTKRGRRIAKADVGRNVELGFAPDGKTLINFDLSDTGNTNATDGARAGASWQLRSLAHRPSPNWMSKDEVTFIPGAQYVKRYSEGALSIVSWSTGKPKYTLPKTRTVRIRQLSQDGRYGVIHERLQQTDSLVWLDFATGTRVALSEGSIDHAAINASGTRVAWARRGGLVDDEVTILRATVSSSGAVTPEN
jgi:hypothetical protein